MNAPSAIENDKSSVTAPASFAEAGAHAGIASGAVEREKDVAIALVGEQRLHLNPAVEARVVRKIDLFLVPVMSIGYGLVYYDKVSQF